MTQTREKLAFVKGKMMNIGGTAYVLIPKHIREDAAIEIDTQADIEIYKTEDRVVIEVSFPLPENQTK